MNTQNQIAVNTTVSAAAFVPVINRVQKLTNPDQSEVLEFLKQRPAHTVVMTGFVRDNNLASENNRGTFYGYRNAGGTLEGVALIGHTTLIETRSADALAAFADAARTSPIPLHVLMSSGAKTEDFFKLMHGGDIQPRLVCTELLFELSFPFPVQNCDWMIRTAQADELEAVAEAHAEVAFIESGVDPLVADRAGFLKRTLRRIEKNRVFVVFENDRLIFKADIVAETDDTIYLEGIYVAPEFRGQGIGSSCLAKLSLELLNRVSNICLLSNVFMKNAHRSFIKAGYKNTDSCQTVFV